MQSPQTNRHRIQRTFRNLSQEEIADVEQTSMLSRLGWAKDVGWETLLESQRNRHPSTSASFAVIASRIDERISTIHDVKFITEAEQ